MSDRMDEPVNDAGLELGTESAEACMFYNPIHVPEDEPPTKRRKTGPQMKTANLPSSSDSGLPRLFDGRESPDFVKARLAAYLHLWTKKQAQLEGVLDDANADSVSRITEFVSTVDFVPSRQLPTGLINAGLASSASGSMFESVAHNLRQHEHYAICFVHASECHNLKASLKTIIQRGTEQTTMDEEDDELLEAREGRRLLNYDLQALCNHIQRQGIERFSVFFQNSEALDPQVLADLVDVLSSWKDRIPFILFFEMAISAELFQEKLARSTVRQLRGALFESKTASEILDILFSAATTDDGEPSILIGPAVSKLLLDRQTDQIASAMGFISALKYCYLMHFYHNPLSFLCGESGMMVLQKEHAEYLKGLPSFQRHLEILSGDGRSAEARKLVKDSKHLLAQARSILTQSRATLANVQQALEILMMINEFTSLRTNLTYSSLYIKALAGDLVDSPIVRELTSSTKKLPSDRMLNLLERLRSFSVLPAADLEANITVLRTEANRSRPPLRSTYDTGDETVRTTVKGQKVVLDKGKKSVNADIAEYTKLVDRIDLLFVSCMANTLVAPRDICFAEVLVFDRKSMVRDALDGAPRAAVERALSRPHDYLACACCDVLEGQLAATQPATALVYQLYLESGASINIQDLWLAFQAIAGREGADAEGQDDETLALFHRALAELRYLGMLKNNKRKADHLAKVRWKGL